MFFIEQYQPQQLSEIQHNLPVISNLSKNCQLEDFNNLLIYGPPDSGKTTIFNLYLRQAIQQYRHRHHCPSSIIGSSDCVCQTPLSISETTMKINNHQIKLQYTQFYYRIDLQLQSKLQKQDLFMTLLHKICSTNNVSLQIPNYIIIEHAHLLKKSIQTSLRVFLEQYTQQCRLFMMTHKINKIIPPIQSRCVLIKINQPTISDIHSICQTICQQESITISENIIRILWRVSSYRLSTFIHFLQIYSVDPKLILRLDYKPHIQTIIKLLLSKNQTKMIRFIEKLHQNYHEIYYQESFVENLRTELLQQSSITNDQLFQIISCFTNYNQYIQFENKIIIPLSMLLIQIYCILHHIDTSKGITDLMK